MNEKIRNFRDNIISEINQSKLPVEVVRLVISEILTMVSAESDKVILQEKLNAIDNETKAETEEKE